MATYAGRTFTTCNVLMTWGAQATLSGALLSSKAGNVAVEELSDVVSICASFPFFRSCAFLSVGFEVR